MKERFGLAALKASMASLIRAIDLRLVENYAELILNAAHVGRTVYAFGNGGSAALASHLVTDLIQISQGKGSPIAIKASALSAETSVLTALANDYSYAEVFSRQLRSTLQEGDIAFAVSTSGRSSNVLKALALARQRGAVTLGLTSEAGQPMLELCAHALAVGSSHPYVIETVHLSFTQLLAAEVRRKAGVPGLKIKEQQRRKSHDL